MCASSFKEIPVIKIYEKGCDPVSTKNLERIITKFEETSSFEAKSGRERKSIASTTVEMATILQEGTNSDGQFHGKLPDL